MRNYRFFVCLSIVFQVNFLIVSNASTGEQSRSFTALERVEIDAARRFFKDLQLIDWGQDEKPVAVPPTQEKSHVHRLEFEYFESTRPIPADPDVKLVAKIKKCLDAQVWISALGMPMSADILMPHAIETVQSSKLLESLINSSERRFGPLIGITYPIPNQKDYNLLLSGVNNCFDSIRIFKSSPK